MAILKLPQKTFTVNIGVTPYQVQYVAGLDCDNWKVTSFTPGDGLVVNINKDSDPITQKVSFFREMLNIVSSWNGIKSRFFAKEEPEDEDVVRCLSAQFAEVYIGNPKLFPKIHFPEAFDLKIGPYVWKVFQKPAVWMNSERCMGVTISSDQEIHIEVRPYEIEMIKTFWHELFHAILDSSGLIYRFMAEGNYPTEMDILHTLGLWLVMVIEDNPEIFPCTQKT